MRIPSGVTDQYVYFVAVDSADFTTRETGLSSFTVYRSRNGGAAAAMTTPTINETDSTNMPGVYELLLDEDMTIDSGDDTQEMAFHITHTGMHPVTRTIELYRPKITAGNTLGVASDGDVSGNVDGNVVGSVASVTGAVGSVTAQVSADVTAISGDSTAADNLEADYDGTGYNKSNSTIGTCTTNTDMLTAAAVNAEVDTALADIHLDHLLAADYDPASKPGTATALLNELVENDGGVSRFTTNALEQGPGGSAPTAAAIADAVWDEAQADHTTAGTFGVTATEIADILTDTNELQTDDVPGLIAALNDPTAAAIADAVWDETQATHTTAGSFGELATEIASILADTNELQTDDVPGLIAALNDLSAAEVNTEVDTALADIHLDHLLAVDYDPASKPGTATALLNELVEDDSGVSRFTVNALENGPSGSGASAASIADAVWDELQADHTTAGSFGEVATEIASILTDTNELQTDDVPGLIAALNDISTADVNAEVDTALADIHLDHLLAADYDPASKPGVATALLNELVENDGGVSRFTANSLEQAPDTDHTGTGSGLSAIPWNAAWDAEVQSEVTDGLNAYDPPTKAELDAGFAALNDLSAAEVNAEVDTALTDIHLDHLLAADYDPASKPGVATALFNELVEDDSGVSRFTVNALENAPSGSGASAETIADAVWDELQSGHTTAGSFGEIASEIASILADTNELQTDDVPGLIAALNDISTAEVNAEVDTALADIHLDHLLAADYDPASKPGIATALLNELVEDDSGVSRFTVNALENGPSGSGASAASIADAVWDEAQGDHTSAGSFGEIASEIANILTDTAEIGAAGAGLTGVPWNASWDAEVQSEVTDALNAYDPPTKTELDAGFAGLNDITAAAVRTEMDSNSTQLAAIVADTGTTLPATLATIDTVVDGIQTDLSNGTDGLGALKALIDTMDANVDLVLADTNELQTDWANGGRLDLLVDQIITDIAALNDVSTADINAQVLDVLNTDTFAEPTGVPAATATLATKIGYLYMALRNRIDVSASKKTFYDDSGSAEWEKDLSDDGSVYSESEANSI